jgi:hypothetical protein
MRRSKLIKIKRRFFICAKFDAWWLKQIFPTPRTPWSRGPPAPGRGTARSSPVPGNTPSIFLGITSDLFSDYYSNVDVAQQVAGAAPSYPPCRGLHPNVRKDP